MGMRFSMGAVVFAVLFTIAAALPAQDDANQLENPGFEEGTAEGLKGWQAYHRGYTVDRAVFHGGAQSIKCTSEGEKDGQGVMQIITYEKPDKRPIIVGGWSKAENVGAAGNYCVCLDIFYDDGSPDWGKMCDWSRGTHDWEYNARIYWPAKPVKEIRTFVFIRRTTGTAWFDDVQLCRGGLHVTSVCAASDYPRTREGMRLSAGLTQKGNWRCALLGGGKELGSLSGSGDNILWYWPGGAGGVPETVKVTAETAKGEKAELEVKVSLPAPSENPVRTGYAVWTENSMRKVYPTEAPPAAAAQPKAELTMARNEREGLQIAIKPADDLSLKNVQLRIGEFVGEDGGALPAGVIEWHVVGYIWVATPSGHPQSPGMPNWCPDVLLPAKPFDVVNGRTQTVWLNVFAPESVKPGTYRGKVTVQPENAAPTDVPITIRVRGFALPTSPRMKTAFAIMDGFTRNTYGDLTPELRRRCLDIMLDHRLNPDDISRTEPPRIEDLLYAREHGMNTFNILNLVPKPKGNPLWVCLAPLNAYGPNFNHELAERLDGYVAELRKHGLAKMAYLYGFDERGEEYDDLIKGICKFLKERYPEVSTFTTAGYMYEKRKKTPPDYQDYMDWYCPLTPRYDLELSDKLRAMGKQVWWYVCCGPQYPYANFASMDYPSVEGRLLGWMTYGYKADGLLFWHVNYWGKNKVIDTQDPYLDWESTCIARMTGDGVLTYPVPGGPVSCIRLENVRDGIEDYDCLSLLAERKGREAAMKHVERLVKDMKEYNRDPVELYRVREQIGDEIEAAR